MTIEKLERTRVPADLSEVGNSSGNLSFSSFDQISLTIDEDYSASFIGIPDNSINYLKVIKGSDNIITFVSGDTIKASQIDKTELYFTISSIDGNVIITQENNQSSGSLLIGDLSISAGTIIAFSFFNWSINNNICTLESKFEVELFGTTPNYSVELSNFNISIVNEIVALASYSNSNDFDLKAVLVDSGILFRVSPDPTVGGDITLFFSGSFQIK